MRTNLDPESALFMADVNRIQKRIADANVQVASGKRVNVASDAPDQIGTLLQLRANLRHNTQIQANLSLAGTDAKASDDAISSAILQMDTALTLATHGANGTLDANSRLSLAQQIQAIQQQMVAYTQTTVQGRFIFSGDQDGSPAYSFDASLANPVVQLSTAASTRQIEDPSGGTFSASQPAHDIFDQRDPLTGLPTASNVFAALQSAVDALNANDTTAIANSVSLLKSSSDHLNSVQKFYGFVQTRIEDSVQFASSYDVQMKTQVSDIADADIAAAALEVTQAGTQLQAAFEMRAQRPHSSLFNYLG